MSHDDVPQRVGLTAAQFLEHLARMDRLAAPLEDDVDRLEWRSPLCVGGHARDHARCSHPSNRRRYDGCTCPCHRRGGAR
jgi:hypothetical protein